MRGGPRLPWWWGLLPIAAFAFLEVRRRRLVAAVGVLTACFIALYVVALRYWAGSLLTPQGVGGLARAAIEASLLLAGLYVGRLLAALLAIFAASGALSGEVESGVLQSVLARPVRRAAVVLGKFAGFGALLVLYSGVMAGAVMVADHLVLGAPVPHALAVLGLLCLEPLVLLALTLLGGTFLSTLANGAAVLMLYGLGMVGGLLEQVGSLSGSRPLVRIGEVTGLFIPADTLYQKAASLVSSGLGGLVSRLAGPFGAGVVPSGAMVVYAALFAVAALGAAVWRFGCRDL